MRITGDWLERPATQSVLACLTEAGHQALLVGGCVRNALLGAQVADVDISSDARPETVTNLAEKAGFKVVPTGIDHGTVTVIASGVPHEITTFRRDVETDGRRAVVAFSDSLHDDAARRDFTMNALYAQADGTVLDPLGGLPDLQARRLRFVGEAETRIREDYLRILRFFRFHAWYGDPSEGLDPEGLAACAALSAGLETISKERIGAEMRKLLAAPDPAPSVAAMAQAGVLRQILPGADPRALAPLVHLEDGLPARWQRRLAVLGGADVAEALRLSTAERRQMAQLAQALSGPAAPAVLAWRMGAEGARDAVLAMAAMTGAPTPQGWAAEVARGAAATFPVKAADLPHLSGPALGRKLKELEQSWCDSVLRMSREQLLA
ncbi:CCA tRNA nucleotidyltransferase [Xinfangfangia sp. CPCC 101601]|uniref:CCA tRNA nucleotidyltransferase n=1 Tax=Pseudogemmobacter lacusdianii TaxID=3069608 RepID=A0ABU0VTV2_9RHOB|nr:CCA tRNA nucleotidyltransferase [Xinfangfangia sp. CPCC 101601]MDQ2065159.1 CCA tRNA nucleotidyltransferase [Xinfangfangia sp. CPCC 101601]